MTFQNSESVRLPNFSSGGYTQTRTRGREPLAGLNPEVTLWMKQYADVVEPEERSSIETYLTQLMLDGKPLPKLGSIGGNKITAAFLKSFEDNNTGDLNEAFNVPGVLDMDTIYR